MNPPGGETIQNKKGRRIFSSVFRLRGLPFFSRLFVPAFSSFVMQWSSLVKQRGSRFAQSGSSRSFFSRGRPTRTTGTRRLFFLSLFLSLFSRVEKKNNRKESYSMACSFGQGLPDFANGACYRCTRARESIPNTCQLYLRVVHIYILKFYWALFHYVLLVISEADRIFRGTSMYVCFAEKSILRAGNVHRIVY